MGVVSIRKLHFVVTVLLCGINVMLLFILLSKDDLYTQRRIQNTADETQDDPDHHFARESISGLPALKDNAVAETNIIVHPGNIHVQDRSSLELHSRLVPNMVYYVWCGNRTFEFRHHLSVLSAWYVLEPDVIDLRYEIPPQEDKYNSWFSWLKAHIPAFQAQPLPPHVKGDLCGDSHGIETVNDRGGVYLDIETVLGQATANILIQNFSCSAISDFYLGFIASGKESPVLQQTIAAVHKSNTGNNTMTFIPNLIRSKGIKVNHCIVVNKEEDWLLYSKHLSNETFCITLKMSIVPENIIADGHNAIKAWFKRIFYGTGEDDGDIYKDQYKLSSDFEQEEYYPQEKKNRQGKRIPFIVHYVWFGASQMTFGMYLSFLSSVHIVKPSAIYIHSDLLLTGPYWQLAKVHPLVHLVYREAPFFIFNRRLLYRQHRSDVVRADLLDKYGGIYLDWDAYWLKSPSDLIESNHEVILSRDHMPRPLFPDTINMGVVLARPRSKFIRAWRSALVNYRSHDFLYNAVELPYKIYERFPDGVYVSDRLQVMCYFLKCHPTFHPDFRHWGRAQPFDWRKDVYAIHFTHPDPPAFGNETALKSSSGIFADMGRYIWNLHVSESQTNT